MGEERKATYNISDVMFRGCVLARHIAKGCAREPVQHIWILSARCTGRAYLSISQHQYIYGRSYIEVSIYDLDE